MALHIAHGFPQRAVGLNQMRVELRVKPTLEPVHQRLATRLVIHQAFLRAQLLLAGLLVVIEDLKDHWERAEAECEARLELITRLVDELRQRRGLFWTIAAARRAVRLDDWWYSKIPPLLAVAYLQALVAHVSSTRLAEVLPCALLSIVCVAAYGHVVNDIFDVDADRRAGKANAMTNVST